MDYADLVAALEGYLNRTDYTTQIPTFITLTEARLNRVLDDPEMEVRATATATGQFTDLPDDFKRMIGVRTSDGILLEQVSGARVTSYDQTVTGTPRQYAIIGNSITFAPINSTTPIELVYVRRLIPLTVSAPTNWLIEMAPDLYLYGCLIQASIFGWFDERIPLFKSAYDEAIQELRIDGQNRKWGSAPIAPRLGRT